MMNSTLPPHESHIITLDQIEQIMTQSDISSANCSTAEGLASLLSAASYMFPETFTQQSTETGDERLLSHDVWGKNTLESRTSEEYTVSATSPGSPDSTAGHRSVHQGSHASNTAGPAKRKRGRPRKSDGNPTSQRPVERRREQIRRAQRAFRSRQEANFANNEARIRQLETAIREMNSMVLSFGEDLAQSGLLMSNPSLQSRLCNVLKRSQDLAEKNIPVINEDRSSISASQESAPSPPGGQAVRRQRQEGSSSSSPPVYVARSPTSPPPRTNIDLGGFPMPLSPGSPLLFDTTDISAVEIPLFIRHLRRACAYHAYFSLRNPLVKLDDLRSKYRFLLSMLSRESLTSYFEAVVQAEVYPTRMDEWKGVPFLSVGGAGTHYPKPSPSLNTSHGRTTKRTQPRSPVREHPLCEVSLQSQNTTNPSWFDVRDLEGFLQEKHVHLLTNPGTEVQRRPSTRTAINPSRLIRILIGTCICLGRSPGWRPVDVEQALCAAVWDTEESGSRGPMRTN